MRGLFGVRIIGSGVDRGVAMTVKIHAELEESIKEDAAAILAASGLTISEALRILLVRVAAEGKLPFDPLVPNQETIEAINAARRGDLVTLGTPAQAIAELNRPD